MESLSRFNPEQLQAVLSDKPRILNLAGAGTGKTATLTGRVSYLNQELRVSCHQMLALTFTRLAGREMKERVIKNIGKTQGSKLFCNTFHAWCVKVLKEYGFNLGYGKDFTIYDQEDSAGIIATIIKEFDYKNITPEKIAEAMGADLATYTFDSATTTIINEYYYRLKQNNAFDFNGLISNTLLLFEKYPDICDEYRKLYKYVFVDEMQDTSDDQWQLMKLLNPENLFVVGDFRQAIYGWRQAKVEIILSLVDDPEWEVIQLRRNYRSTFQIVDTANILISHSKYKSEGLITDLQGESIVHKEADDDSKEARWIALTIGGLVENNRYTNFAVLARTNKQLDNMKPIFDQFEVPVEVVNNNNDILTKNYIRMIFSYLELKVNPLDNIAFKRAVNFPEPRMTDLELQHVIMMATSAELSLNDYMTKLNNEKTKDFYLIMSEVDLSAPAYRTFTELVERLKLREYYTAKSLVNRIEGIDQAITRMQKWCDRQDIAGEDNTTSAFFKWLRIRDIQEKLSEPSNTVKLMTVHASKGLEFDTVFVAGMNQGLFPSKKGDLEEERRLFYVALTRAKRHLYISRPVKIPDWNGYPKDTMPSQFIGETMCN
jgi:DNA helicase-2/ATP-dependent DNA helicase PcrA